MNNYRNNFLDFNAEKDEEKSFHHAAALLKGKEKGSTFPTVDYLNSLLAVASASDRLKGKIMDMLPDLVLFIEEQQNINLTEKDKEIDMLKSQIDQMEYLLINKDITPLTKYPIVFPEDLSSLNQNFPNPCADQTTIECFVPTSVMQASLDILSPAGDKIRSVKITDRCHVTLELNLSDLISGCYTYQLIGDGSLLHSKTMAVLK